MLREKKKKLRKPPITYKSPEDIEAMRKAGRVVAECHALMREMARPGVRTKDMDQEVERLIRSHGGVPAFLGYPGPDGIAPFPASICASVNDEVVHGIPNRRRLQDGDILSVDVGVELGGYFGDAASTLVIGAASDTARRLIDTAWASLEAAIAAARPGGRLSDIARAVQEHAEPRGYGLVRQFVGHGIGRSMHEQPQVPNYVSEQLLKHDLELKPGLVLAIEPMLNVGTHEVKVKKNQWTVATRDGKLSAHVEHTVAIREDGPDVLTLPA